MITPISVSKTLAAKDKLFEKVLSNYIGAILAGEIFGQFVLDVRDVLGDTCDKTAVLNSLRVSAGLELTAERAEEISWRLAGNLHRLRKGAPVMPWREQTVKEWVPVEVVNVVKHKRSYKASTPEQAAVADLRAHPPRWVYYSDVPPEAYLRIWPTSDPARLRMPEIEGFIRAQYREVDRVEMNGLAFRLLSSAGAR